MMKGKIIVFEGLDCSFKETNSKALEQYLKSIEVPVKLKSFPSYDDESSIFVRKYLNGLYGDMKNLSISAISSFYMIDMFDYFKTKGNELLESGCNIILDRYWYSNIFYRLGLLKSMDDDGFVNAFDKRETILSISNIAEAYQLPKADIIFKMTPDKDIMLQYAAKKHSDIHESNSKYLSCVFDSYLCTDFTPFLATDGKCKNIFTCKNGKIKSEEDIFDEIKLELNRMDIKWR